MKTILTSTILLWYLFVIGQVSPNSTNNFITKWETGNSTSITWNGNLTPSYNYNYNVYCIPAAGGTPIVFNDITTAAFGIYGLSPNTEYILQISDDLEYFNPNNPLQLLEIIQWGSIEWKSLSNSFSGCSNLDITSSDIPNLFYCEDLSYIFNQCNSLKGETANWNWNTSSVIDLNNAFKNCWLFNQSIESWDVSSVVDLSSTFENCFAFNQPLGNWNISLVTSLKRTFFNAVNFNQNISNWNTINVKNMNQTFAFISPGIVGVNAVTNNYNQPLDGWNTVNVIDMNGMFQGCHFFNQNISTFNTSNCVNISNMFRNCLVFNQPLDNWNLEKCEGFANVFNGATSFNQPLNSWNVQKGFSFVYMFSNATNFNQPLNNWVMLSALELQGMFSNATNFNQPLDNWYVEKVINFNYIFRNATSFNGDVSTWNTPALKYMSGSFMNAVAFNKNIGGWNVEGLTQVGNPEYIGPLVNVFNNSGIDCENYSLILKGWSGQSVNSAIEIGVLGLNIGGDGLNYRNQLINNNLWVFNGDVLSNIPSASLSGIVSFCLNTSSVFTSSIPGGVWSTLGSNEIDSISGVVLGGYVGSDTINYVYIDPATSCISTSSLSFEILDLPLANIENGNIELCIGDSITLTGSSLENVVNWYFTSSNGFTELISGTYEVNLFNVNLANEGFYHFQSTDVNGCSSDTSAAGVFININDLPFLDSLVYLNGGDSSAFCINGEITLFSPFNSNWQYSWSGPNGWTSSVQNPIIAPANSFNTGYYSLVVHDLLSGCSSSGSTNSIHVEINDLPILDSLISLNPLVVGQKKCVGETVELFSPFNSNWQYSWSGPNGWTSSVQNPVIAPVLISNNGIYTLTITDQTTGCQNNSALGGDNFNLLVNYCDIPEVLTPNGDGLNDSWELAFLSLYPQNKVTIINRWGTVVYFKEKYENNFSGKGNTFSSGEILPNGTYYYLIELGDGSKLINGYLELIN